MSRPCRVGFEGIALYPSASSHFSVVSAYSAEADSTDYFIQATVALRIAMAVALALSVSTRRSGPPGGARSSSISGRADLPRSRIPHPPRAVFTEPHLTGLPTSSAA